MADRRITEHTALTGAGSATTDLVEVVDVSDTTDAATGTNKKMTLTELATALTTHGSLATDTELADYVAKALFDAHTVLAATTDNTPAALTVGEQTLVGRITGGNITALSAAQVRTLLDVPTNAEAILDTLVDAKGDILTATAADTPARLAVGTNDQILVAASGQSTGLKWQGAFETLIIPIGDETTAITTGTAKVTFRMPFAMTVTAVRASLTTASSSGTPTFDINETGTTILSTKLTIDANELTSTTAAAAAVISDSALADDAQITIDIDTAGTGAAGAKIYIIGTRA